MNGAKKMAEKQNGIKKQKNNCVKCQKKPVIIHNKVYYCADCYITHVIKKPINDLQIQNR